MNEHQNCSECEGQEHHRIAHLKTDGTYYAQCKHCEDAILMSEETTFINTSNGCHTFYFVCEGCRTEGVMTIQADRLSDRLPCPEDCGAVYILWHNPIENRPALMGVVVPVFEEV